MLQRTVAVGIDLLFITCFVNLVDYSRNVDLNPLYSFICYECYTEKCFVAMVVSSRALKSLASSVTSY